MNPSRLIVVTLAALTLAACATPGGEFSADTSGPSPQQLAGEPGLLPKGTELTWGGTIVRTTNLADRTVIEVLGYPLDGRGRPDIDAPPQGRFLADRSGFLEPEDYRPGRELTVRGPLLGFKDGQVGAASYRFPALGAERLKLWSRSVAVRQPRIGVSVGAGSHGGGIGIGVGF